MGDNVVDVDASIEGDPAEISFNAKYLIDLLSVVDSPQVVLETGNPDENPGVLRVVGVAICKEVMQSLSSSNQPSRIFALDKDIHPPEYILKTDVCTIGRSNMCEIVVERKIISRLHAKIEREGPRYFLHDANSAR